MLDLNKLKRILEKNSYPEPNTGCWLWGGSTAGQGEYGHIQACKPRIYAHRAAYMVYKGQIPKGMYVMHTCDVPGCVNPDHLLLGTPSDNNSDKIRKHRDAFMKGTSSQLKLSQEDIKEIRRMSAAGVRNIDIAKKFNVSPSTTCDIKYGKRWSRVI